jgi:hypothetical protein
LTDPFMLTAFILAAVWVWRLFRHPRVPGYFEAMAVRNGRKKGKLRD